MHIKKRGEIMFCAKCGNPINDGAHFCPFCGAPAGGTPAPQQQPASGTPPAMQQGTGCVLPPGIESIEDGPFYWTYAQSLWSLSLIHI